jgi:outer membrane protein assembly complex protein YaeT
MKRPWLLLLFFAATAFAQTDAPPNLDDPLAPDEMPRLDEPSTKPRPSGKVQVQFVGASAFPEGRLKEAVARPLATIDEMGLDAANAYDAAFFLESFYRKNGYTEAEVKSEITGGGLRLEVKEGPLARVGTVTIVGNHAFTTKELSDYLLGPTRERFPRVKKDLDLPLVEADINSGGDIVSRLYASTGYLDAEIGAPAITYNASHTVGDVTLTVKEGTQYRFGAIRFEGDPVFPTSDLLADVVTDTKDIYTPGRLQAAERALEDYYKKRGYFTADVSGEADLTKAKGGQVPVTFRVAAGPLYHFDGTTVKGTRDVPSNFLQKRLHKLSGQVYSPQAVDDRYRELVETGLFRTINITPSAIDGNLVRLDVSVEEAKPKEFGVGLGFATFDGGILDVSYTDRNFFHSARPFSAQIEVTQRGYSGEVSYRDPWLFDSDYALQLRLYALNRRLVGYTKQELGFQPTLSRYIGKHWQVSAFVLAKTVVTNDILIEPESLVGKTNYSVASIGISQTLDFRNNVTLPTKGFIFTTTADLAPDGLGSVSFARATARFSYYLPVTAKSGLAFGARGGIIGSLGDNGLPIDERFFNGGSTTVRSYPEYNLGPRDRNGYPLGGEGFTVFNAEYTFPIWGDLQGAAFGDAGNVVPRAADFGLSDMRYALGAGLRYNLPIGALRLDYGWNPAPHPGDAQGAFHFAIGVSF